ncbi:MAG: hypothetical protein QOJ35_2115 [Solirubrobacteraceae bacterium]|nr:hypothetical protein [Solirubrobacteraceae bacterium]
MASLVAVYRGVFLYGDSGTGKSSLVNAGLLPQAGRLGLEPVRLRVQPRAGEELVINRIVADDDASELLPCPLAPDDGDAERIVLSIAEFEKRVRAVSQEHRLLIVFDQFEEILTLFDDADASRQALAAMMVRLLREPLPVKLLFAFREDYLGRVKQLLCARPELVDQALRLGPPSADALTTIIRGPFERFPERYHRVLDDALAERLRAALAERFGTGDVSLSEVETVCLRLWMSPDPGALLAEKGLRGLLEDELGEALEAFAPGLRIVAIALLSHMVTAAGTRNVVSAEDLRQRVAEDDKTIPPALVDEALERLERDSKLVRRERRRDIYLYEITSEFLVPWISRRREELRHAHEHRRERRRQRILGAIAASLFVVLAGVAALAVWALMQRDAATRATRAGISRQLAARATDLSKDALEHGLTLSLAAQSLNDTVEARRSLLAGLLSEPRLARVLHDGEADPLPTGFSGDGTRFAAFADDGHATVWDVASGRVRAHTRPADYLAADVNAETQLLAKTTPRAPGAIDLYKLGSGAPSLVGTLRDRDHRFDDVLFAADGRRLAAVTASHELVIWDVPRRHRLRRPPGRHYKNVWDFSMDGATLAVATTGGAVALWDVARGTRRVVPRDPQGSPKSAVEAVALDPSGHMLAVARDNPGGAGAILLYDADRATVTARISTGRASVSSLDLSRRFVAASSFDGSEAWLWDAATGKRAGHRLRGVASFGLVHFSADGRRLAIGSGGGAVSLFDPSGQRSLGGRLSANPGGGLVFAAGGRAVVTGDRRRRRISVVALDGSRRTYPLRVPGPAATDVLAVNPVTGVVAALTARRERLRREGVVVLYDPRDGRTVTLPRSIGDAPTAAFSPDGRTLAVGGSLGAITLWNAASGKSAGAPIAGAGLPRKYEYAGIESLSFDADGGRLLAYSRGVLASWDVSRRGPRDILLRPGDRQLVAVDRSHRIAALLSAGGSPTLWDVPGHRSLGGLLVDTTYNAFGAGLAAFSPDSSLLAITRAKDGRITDNGTYVDVFDVRTHQPVARLTVDGTIDAMSFGAPGQTLATATARGIQTWRLDGAYVHGRACQVIDRDLSQADWRTLVGSLDGFSPICGPR